MADIFLEGFEINNLILYLLLNPKKDIMEMGIFAHLEFSSKSAVRLVPRFAMSTLSAMKSWTYADVTKDRS